MPEARAMSAAIPPPSKPAPKVLRVKMSAGEHNALAVLHQDRNAVTIHAVERQGLPTLPGDGKTYADITTALERAFRIWSDTVRA
jgi:hypothetical protein